MESLTLVTPNLAYEADFLAYKTAFQNERLYDGNHLDTAETIADWLLHLERFYSYTTFPEGRPPSSTLLCIREVDQTMAGVCNIRHDLNQIFLITIAGHIGYSVHPYEHRKFY